MGRCDSWVVETDVHYPTDINLLFDATRKVIELTARAMSFNHCRDSRLLEESNYQTVKAEMFDRFPDDVYEASFSHWAVGWVEYVIVRALDDDGNPTEAFKVAMDIREFIRGNGYFDDEDYFQRETEATIENIRQIRPSWAVSPDAPDNWASEVCSWISYYVPDEIENVDDEGGWPQEHVVVKAVYELGFLDKYALADDRREEIAESLKLDPDKLPWSEDYGVTEAVPMELQF